MRVGVAAPRGFFQHIGKTKKFVATEKRKIAMQKSSTVAVPSVAPPTPFLDTLKKLVTGYGSSVGESVFEATGNRSVFPRLFGFGGVAVRDFVNTALGLFGA